MEQVIMCGSTPVNTFEVPYRSEDVSEMEIGYFQGGKVVILKRKSDIELRDYLAKVRLTEDETLSLKKGTKVKIQSRVKDIEGNVIVSEPIVVSVEECLFEESM
jgi:hypothetical protein